jgi:hypothetical protein
MGANESMEVVPVLLSTFAIGWLPGYRFAVSVTTAGKAGTDLRSPATVSPEAARRPSGIGHRAAAFPRQLP